MTLKEIKGEVINDYQDDQALSQNHWARILGYPAGTVRAAAFRGGVIAETRPPRFGNQPNLRVIYVSDFPKIIDGFAQTFSTIHQYPFHPWAQNIDLSADFELEPPSGAKLIYEYPKK